MYLNPIALVIEQTRVVSIECKLPSMSYLVLGTCIGVVVCEIAYRFFNARKGFADVL